MYVNRYKNAIKSGVICYLFDRSVYVFLFWKKCHNATC
jgi:hypothetical protein